MATQVQTHGGATEEEIVDTVTQDEDSSYEMRKRIRNERRKSTQEKIKTMKERQRQSEIVKKRQPYLQVTCSAIVVVAAFYLFYRFYWSVG